MLRIWLGVLIVGMARAGVDEEAAFDLAYPIAAFLSWVPNLLVAEYLLRKRPLTART